MEFARKDTSKDRPVAEEEIQLEFSRKDTSQDNGIGQAGGLAREWFNSR